MITVYGRPNSTNVKKVLWTLEELEVEYDNIKLGGIYGGNKDEKYLNLNPNGLIPTLQDDDFTLWESNTIVRYLCAYYLSKKLWIDDPKQRAQADKWMDWSVNAFSKPFPDIIQNVVRLPQDQRDPKALQAAIHQFENGLSVLEQQLAKTPYLSGDIFSMGDISTGVFIYYYYELKLANKLKFTHVENWYERLSQRPAYKKIVMIPID